MEGRRVLLSEAEEVKAHGESAERNRAFDIRLARAHERERFGGLCMPELAQDLRERTQQRKRLSLYQRRIDARSVGHIQHAR